MSSTCWPFTTRRSGKALPPDRPKRIPAIACFWSKLRSCWGGWFFLEIDLFMYSKAVHTFTKKWYQIWFPKKDVKQQNDIFHLYIYIYVRFLPCFHVKSPVPFETCVLLPGLLRHVGFIQILGPNLMPKGAITEDVRGGRVPASGCLLANSNQMVHWHHQSISIGRCQSPGVQKKKQNNVNYWDQWIFLWILSFLLW